MRKLTGYKVNGVNDLLQVLVLDEPGQGGACHRYHITSSVGVIESEDDLARAEIAVSADLEFQNGPIGEAGVNGITHETLLAVLIDRLECFQRGPFACVSNSTALGHLRKALKVLLARTRARAARGVEGTNQV